VVFFSPNLMEIGRETKDLDFLLTRMKAEEKALQETFEQIISVHSADGLTFSFDSIQVQFCLCGMSSQIY
jgi:hypothetical protein